MHQWVYDGVRLIKDVYLRSGVWNVSSLAFAVDR